MSVKLFTLQTVLFIEVLKYPFSLNGSCFQIVQVRIPRARGKDLANAYLSPYSFDS